VSDETISLDKLSGFVGRVTKEQQIIPRRHFPSESHEEKRIEGQRRRHLPGNIFGVLLEVGDGGQRKAPIGHGTPKVGRAQVRPKVGAF